MNFNTEYAILYADGGSWIKGKKIDDTIPSSFAYIIKYQGKVYEYSKAYWGKTNNAMELSAVIAGLSAIAPEVPIRVMTDSNNIYLAMTAQWYVKWEESNWTKPA